LMRKVGLSVIGRSSGYFGFLTRLVIPAKAGIQREAARRG